MRFNWGMKWGFVLGMVICILGIMPSLAQSLEDEIEQSPLSLLPIEQSSDYLMFDAEMLAIQQAGGTWSEMFDHDSLLNKNQVIAVVVWWLVIILFGWSVWGILFAIFPALPDRGYSFAKVTGLLLVMWILFTLGTLRVQIWNQQGVLLVLAGLTVINALVCWRQWDELRDYIKQNWRLLLNIELITAGLFGLFLIVRLIDPDLWGYTVGEKAMNFSYFNGVLRSTIFPAIDPWFASGYNNYYYLGTVIIAVPTLLTGIIPSIAFNLLLATVFALTGIGAFGLAYNITRVSQRVRQALSPYLAGMMAIVLSVMIGNLEIPRLIFNTISEIGGYYDTYGSVNYYHDQALIEYQAEHGMPADEETSKQILEDEIKPRYEIISTKDSITYELALASWRLSSFFNGVQAILFDGAKIDRPPAYWFVTPSRTIAGIPNPIYKPYTYGAEVNETPIASFVYADLHAQTISHMMVFLSMSFVLHEFLIAGEDRRNLWKKFIALALGALVIGLFRGSNTWDYPTFMIFGVVGLALAWWFNYSSRRSIQALTALVVRIAVFVLLTFVAIAPYDVWYHSDSVGIYFWTGLKTPLWAYLQIHGYLLFLAISLLVWDTAQWIKLAGFKSVLGKRSTVITLVLIGLITLVIASFYYQIALIAIPGVTWLLALFFRQGQRREMQYLFILIGLGLAITLGTEIFAINIDVGRKNSIFKFYLQNWLLLSIVGGVGTAYVFAYSHLWKPYLRNLWRLVFAVLLVASLAFPLVAIVERGKTRYSYDVPLTLDGAEYMQYAEYIYPSSAKGYPAFVHDLRIDYEVIRWLQEHVQGSPTIIEANTQQNYTLGSRISVYTGLPTIIGWNHQNQQRRGSKFSDHLENRYDNTNRFYETLVMDEAALIIDHYDIGYVILSDFEQGLYGIGETYGETGALKKQKFADMEALNILETVFKYETATIYRVNEIGLQQYLLTRNG